MRSFSLIAFFILCSLNIKAQGINDSTKRYLQKTHFGMTIKKAKKELGAPLSHYVMYGDLRAGKRHHRRQVFVFKYSSQLRLQFNKHYHVFKFHKKAYLTYVTVKDSTYTDQKKIEELAR